MTVPAIRPALAAATLCGALLLAGCGGLRSSAPDDNVYVLRPVVAATPVSPAQRATLQVHRPVMQPGLETDRIALLLPGGRLDYYAAARWAGSLPNVIGALAVETLRTSGAFANVEDERTGFVGDYVLGISVRHFELQYDTEPAAKAAAPAARVTFDVTLAPRGDRRILASFRSEATVQAGANRVGEAVTALELAAQQAIADVQRRTYEALATAAAAREAAAPPPARGGAPARPAAP